MKKISLFSLIIFLGATLSFMGCTKEGCTDINALNYDAEAKDDDGKCTYPDILVGFDYKVGQDDFSYGTTYSINGVATSFSLLQFYVSGVNMMGPDLNYDIEDSYALVKPDGGMYTIGKGKVTHTQTMTFNLGIDPATNSQSETDFASWAADHPLAAQSPNMHWNWLKGYIFLKLEGMVDTNNDGTPDSPLVAHCGTDDLMRTVGLEIHKEVDSETAMVHYHLDWAKLFTDIDIANDNITHTGDNIDLAVKIMDNFPSIFSVKH